ncbi:MAG: Fe-S protein assembly co-chaperone HscB [Bryobacteraceae bacterium]
MLAGPPPSDYFAIFGIEKKLALDVEDLQRRFYAKSREWHPDGHARAGAQQLAYAELASATLNDAWRVLRDPISRADYLLKGEGFDIGEQRGRDVPPELLEEVFELNMALEEVRDGDAAAKTEVARALARFERLLAEIDKERDAIFVEYDASPNRETLTRLRTLLNRRKYLQNLVRDASAALA